MFWRRPTRKSYEALRDQRDLARKQRDRLALRTKRLMAELRDERNRALLPPYSQLTCSDRDQQSTEIVWPERGCFIRSVEEPGLRVAFVTVANRRFLPGLEGLLLSLLDVYPDLSSPFFVFHDGSLTSADCSYLLSVYPRIHFDLPTPPWADELPLNSPNRERIGLLGYLNIYSLSLQGFDRVVVLDSDVLVFGSLDPLWAPGDAFRACIDCGALPYGLVSQATGLPVINSGVISIPGWALGGTLLDHIHALIRQSAEPTCPFLDQFADQKVWNLLLADQKLEILPINLNCNVKYLVQFLDGCIEGLSLIHFAGPKPWLRSEQPRGRSKSIVDHWLWIRHYRKLLYAHRLSQYSAYLRNCEAFPVAVAEKDMTNGEYSAILSFNPLALLSRQAGSPSRHLVLHSQDQFCFDQAGHWEWPAGWGEAILSLSSTSSLHVWAPFQFRLNLAELSLPRESQLHFILLEIPFSAPDLADQGGAAFVPWRGSSADSMRAAVEQRLPVSQIHWL